VKRIRLPDLGSHEFEAAYRAAVAGQPLPPRTRPSAQSLARQGEAGALASAVRKLAVSLLFGNFGIDFQCNLVIIQEV
jgi:hypothetical protein